MATGVARRSAFVVGLLLSALTPPAMAAGSWVADSVAPTIRQQGMRYSSERLSPRAGTRLSGQAIARVSWHYGLSRWTPELAVLLCGGGRCTIIDGERGGSRAFAGLPPTTTFRFHFRVAGQPMAIAPLYGRPLQLVVNFE